MGLGLENLTMIGINCYRWLQGESVENILIYVDHQILAIVKRCADTSFKARRFTQKDFASPLCHLVVKQPSAIFYKRFNKSSCLILCCKIQYGTTE